MHQFDFEAWRHHQREMAREVRQNRLARRLRGARPGSGLVSRLFGRPGSRTTGAPRAAG